MNKLLIIILTLLTTSVHSQEVDTSNVYYKALNGHINYWKTFNAKKPDLYQIPEFYLVEKDDYTTNNIPEIIAGQKIKILDREELIALTKGNKVINLIALRPARWRDGALIISVINFRFSRKKNHFYYSNGGGSSFEIIGSGDTKLQLKVLRQGGI